MIRARSVVLYTLVTHFELPGSAKVRYKRLKRFVQFVPPETCFASLVLNVLPRGKQWLILDRTHCLGPTTPPHGLGRFFLALTRCFANIHCHDLERKVLCKRFTTWQAILAQDQQGVFDPLHRAQTGPIGGPPREVARWAGSVPLCPRRRTVVSSTSQSRALW